jgi:hypothetical protein
LILRRGRDLNMFLLHCLFHVLWLLQSGTAFFFSSLCILRAGQTHLT